MLNINCVCPGVGQAGRLVCHVGIKEFHDSRTLARQDPTTPQTPAGTQLLGLTPFRGLYPFEAVSLMATRLHPGGSLNRSRSNSFFKAMGWQDGRMAGLTGMPGMAATPWPTTIGPLGRGWVFSAFIFWHLMNIHRHERPQKGPPMAWAI